MKLKGTAFTWAAILLINLCRQIGLFTWPKCNSEKQNIEAFIVPE